MSRVGFSHLIPLPDRGRTILSELAPSFGGKAETVELGLGWGIRNGVARDPEFPSRPQIHVHLSEDYRSRFNPQHLGTMLLQALDFFRSKVPNGIEEPRGLWYWDVGIPALAVRSIRTYCFDHGIDPNKELATRFREALVTVKQDLPAEMDAPYVATDPATRRLYKDLAAAADHLGLDIDTLVVAALARSSKRDQ